ncbi:CHAT domain-containing protein [Xanthocytophaga agilis]|uniref:CHAT domain-containing protein n=1 Tax=Xanthocytophaga agilis TaxID=3048010 RepID=A0AAE3R4K4_9BACT|nr:CHAT domain-containing protein [Xanthocytophaga agilis]MDJ1503511.1 CHAT domain-containing protein [Xanthocytophaga agilis]
MQEQLRNLIAQGNLDEAINQLLKLTRKTPHYNDIILLSARLNQLNREINRELILGITDTTNERTQKVLLIQAVLTTLDLIDWQKIEAQIRQNKDISNPTYQVNQEQQEHSVKTILFLGANPTNTTQLRLGEEAREIDNELRLAKDRDKFNLELQWATTVDILRRALLSFNPHFIHFSGHGAMEGIVLEDKGGNANILPPEVLADLISLFATTVQCVILNACYSEEQAKAIIKHIPYVIGMNDEIPDKSAIKFAAAFYSGIGHGRSIPDSFRIGKIAVTAENLENDMIILLEKSH